MWLFQVAKLEQEQAAQANKLAWLKDMFNDVDIDGSGAIDASGGDFSSILALF